MALHEGRDMGEVLRMLEAARSEVGSAGSPRMAEPHAAARPPSGLVAAPGEGLPQEPTLHAREAALRDPRSQAAPRRPRKRLLLVAGGLAAFAVAGAAGVLYWDHAGRFQSTDDAFIAARQFSVAPKVSGYVASVPVTDNQHVAAGDVIARIDDRDYRVTLAQAEAQVAAAEDNIHNIDSQIGVQEAQVDQAKAQVDQAQAALVFADQQAARYQELVEKGAGTVQSAQQYSSGLKQQDAAVKTAQAALTAAERQVDTLKGQRKSAEANLAEAQTQRDQAALNLSYTVVTAAEPGRVANLSAAAGQLATAGTALATFVPDEIWVTANFKETQLDHMRPGQPVTIAIDAYPERTINGHVASVQPGSGSAFSLLPAENATGNYVKIVQRVPVKIDLDNPPADVALGPGMSVVPTVRTDPERSLVGRLMDRVSHLIESAPKNRVAALPGGRL